MGGQWKLINANYKNMDGYKRVAWPPVSEERIVREFTPQPTQQAPQQPIGVQPSYRAASYDNYQPQVQQQNHYQHPHQQPAPRYGYQQEYQQPAQHQPAWANPTAPVYHHATAQPNPPYSVETQTNRTPYNSYSQFQQQQYQQHQNHHQQQQLQQQHYASSVQPISQDQVDQQAANAHSLPQDYRGGSPGIITLRKEVPVSQKPAPVYTSQPAAVSFQGGSNMRGDLKWPPVEYKEAAARENEERRKLALGPVCRPRKVKRDYTTFFAKNALNCYYPSYKVPPGTQHMLA